MHEEKLSADTTGTFDDHHINYSYICAPRTVDARLNALDQEISRVGYISLTDAIAHYKYGGTMVMETLAAERQTPARTWKIRVLKDEWGNVPKPGDVVTRRIQRQLRDRAGRKLRSTAVNDMKRRGTFDKQFVDEHKFVVDNKGCIDCTYEHAAHFLTVHGVHYESKAAMGGHREMSSAPCKAPDGSMLHIHYWRYEEAPPWVYETLPDIGEQSDNRPKRGHTTTGTASQ